MGSVSPGHIHSLREGSLEDIVAENVSEVHKTRFKPIALTRVPAMTDCIQDVFFSAAQLRRPCRFPTIERQARKCLQHTGYAQHFAKFRH